MGNFSKLKTFVKTVQQLSGNGLLTFVATYKDDEVVKDFLRYVYDKKAYVYGVTPKDMLWSESISDEADWIRTVGGLEVLNNQRSNDYEMRNLTIDLLDEGGIVVYSILNRKIPDAVLGAAVINKAIPGLITEFKVAKAKNIEWGRINENEEYSCERKYDGNNIYIIGNRFFTREGHEVYLPLLRMNIPNDFDGTLATECCIGDGKLGDRKKVQGLITKGRKKTISADEQRSLKFYCFDYLTKVEWDNQLCANKYEDRINKLKDILPSFSMEYKIVYRIRTGDLHAMKRFLKEELSRGYEGVVIKPQSHLYEWKRGWNWMRHKDANTADLQIVELKEGTGKNTGKLGAFVCEGTINNTYIKVDVGQGFKDWERECFFRSHYVGRIVEITYNEITSDGSLTIPIFVSLRCDKETSDNA